VYIACSTLGCDLAHYPRIDEAIARLASLGFQAIDLAAFEGGQNVDASRRPQ